MDTASFILKYFKDPTRDRRQFKVPTMTDTYRLSVQNEILFSYRLPIARINRATRTAYILDINSSMTTNKHLSRTRYYAREMGYTVYIVGDLFNFTNALVSLTHRCSKAAADVLNKRKRIETRLRAAIDYKDERETALMFALDHDLPDPAAAIPTLEALLPITDRAIFALAAK